jgi:hypothetical protein
VRRLFWVAVGLGAGATGAIIASRWTRRQIERAKPAAIAREAKGGLLDLSKLVAESIEEGKRAMGERERELRATNDLPSPGTPPSGAPGDGPNAA